MRRIASLVLATAAATGIVGGVGAGVASASTEPTGDAPAAVESFVPAETSSYLHPGWSADFPTWLFGSTELCVLNLGPVDGQVEVRSRSPFAGPEYVDVAGYGQNCINRNWYAVPVTATNLGSTDVIVTTR